MPYYIPSLVILFVTSLGFAYYFSIAQRGKTSRVEQFFVAGRNIGLPLFTQTTWGTSFAFGNSIFYAIWLGYSIGLSAFWIQSLWAIGMCCYALLLPRLIGFTQDYTLHGFLGSLYGKWCRITASIVSVIGLVICLGFEISFAAQYFAQVTNLQHFEWLVVLASAIFIATFCSIGGFKANTVTDRLTNYITLGTITVFLVILVAKSWKNASVIFSPAGMFKSATDFSSSNWIYLSGLAFFALFNLVDMSNWRNVSANSLNIDNSPDSLLQGKNMKRAMFKAARNFMFAPVLIGTFIGYILRVLSLGTQNQSSFMSKIVLDILPITSVFAVIALAIITFSFMASSLSGTDSWLLASTQTLSWDLFDYKKFKSVKFKITHFDEGLHEKITKNARVILMLVGIGGALLVYYVSKYVWNDVFALQFVIFGGGLAMLPSLLYGLFKGNPTKSKIISMGSLLSIIIGYSSALALFFYSLYKRNPDLVSPLPLISLGVAILVFALSLVIEKIFKRDLK